MRVVFIICSFGHGRGGHFHSLAVIAKTLSKNADCLILNVGLKPSIALEESGVDYIFIEFDGRGLLKCMRKLANVIRRFEPDVLHSFDVAAHFWARLIGRRLGLRVVHNKCGGPDPRRYYPHASNLVAFSAENFDYFRAQGKFKNSLIEHIPNRSTGVETDAERVARLTELSKKGCSRIMRISRFSPAYKNSLLQTIEFAEGLNAKSSTQYQLILVGAIQSKEVFDEVTARACQDVLIITEDYFTRNASELLACADVVVATGRGVMEAASLGKPILVPADGLKYPVLMTSRSFEDLFKKNFSPRVNPTNLLELGQIAAMLEDAAVRKKLSDLSKSLFDLHFSIDHAAHRYVGLYDKARSDRRIRFVDLTLNFAVMARYFYLARNA